MTRSVGSDPICAGGDDLVGDESGDDGDRLRGEYDVHCVCVYKVGVCADSVEGVAAVISDCIKGGSQCSGAGDARAGAGVGGGVSD